MFNEATQNIYKLSYDAYYTERPLISDMIGQVDKGSAQQVNGPKYLKCAHQTRDRIENPNKNKDIAIFDNVDLRKFFVEIDDQRYPRDGLFINYAEKNYIVENKGLKSFYRKYLEEQTLQPFLSYSDMKTKYPIEIIDLRHQAYHITPKKINSFKNMVRIPTRLDCFQY